MSKELSPWTFIEFTEAIEHATEAQRRVMYCSIAVSVDFGLKNDHANHLALTAICKLVEDYWEKANET